MGWRARRIGVAGAVAPALVLVLLAGAMAPARSAPADPAPQDTKAGEGPAPDPPAAPWLLPTLHIGGVLGFEGRREWYNERETRQRGATGTIHIRSSTHIWEPWFAQASGNLGITASQDNSGTHEVNRINSSSIRSLIVTGAARLSVLELSRFPFEAHYDRNNSRVDTDLSLGNAYASERIGFSQRLLRTEGDATLGFDRNTQNVIGGGRDRQDSLQLGMGWTRAAHRVALNGAASRNTRSQSAESALQNNLTLQYGYTPGSTLMVDNSINLSRSDYQLQQGDSQSALGQMSSMLMWRPEESTLAVVAGLRVFGLEMENSIAGRESADGSTRLGDANVNLGVSYDLSASTRVQANANLNRGKAGARDSSGASQNATLSYTPPAFEIGAARYGWSASSTAANRTGGVKSSRQVGLQLGHQLSRSFTAGNSSISVDGSQSITGFVASGGTTGVDGSRQHLTNGASASWVFAGAPGNAMLRLSASDARALSGNKEFFQLVNLQATTNLATSNFSTWNGGLTIQAVRQSAAFVHFDPLAPNAPLEQTFNPRWVATSSGSLSYQNQRLFKVARLRFTSDLRLNAQGLLPLLGKARDQETAAWENRLEYAIGRTQLRISVVISRANGPMNGPRLPGDPKQSGGVQTTNRAVMINLARGFGHFR